MKYRCPWKNIIRFFVERAASEDLNPKKKEKQNSRRSDEKSEDVVESADMRIVKYLKAWSLDDLGKIKE